MTESANLMPFVCKWLYSHSKPQHFETQEKLRKHIDEHDINSCNRASIGDPIYICPWEGCNKHQSSITKLEEHLHRHSRQRPFKCPICTGSRFCSLDALNRHLIINHNDSVVDSDTDNDTLCDENEKLNLDTCSFLVERKTEDKNDVRVEKKSSKDEATISIKGKDKKNEFIPTNNNTKLSYRDVLVNGRNKHDQTVQELLYMAMEAISSLPRQVEYDLDNENCDDLPDAPQGEILSEDQQDELMWEAFRKAYEGSKAVEYFSKAFSLMEGGP
ncbi:hypothetical protein RirG_121350 [Rhizophagus irregularis DAOM 197198w]|uniref:C2H2-type domain-containing protein n=1 Tax=Rhizophagus irregularis (strain DAOM 197198w) TaxID=1432141 RepID=A0A015JB16_RHIIW|nr:hypothetical protein RirG_121350 [Rhizophagus irregularis DAOM 197198w]